MIDTRMQRRHYVCLFTLLILLCFTRTADAGRPLLAAASVPQRRRPRTLAIATTATGRKGGGTSTAKTKKTSAWLDGCKSGLASAMAAACVKTLLQPIDAIKTTQQYAQQSNGKSLSLLQACQSIVSRPGGIGNFYAGLGVTVIGAMPGVALYFGVYSYCKQHLLQTNVGRQHKTLSIAISAAIGNSVASFSRVPYEVIKQKLQTGVYTSTWQALKDIVTTRQIQLIFPRGGVAIQMIRDVPYAICTLLLYESLQSYFSSSTKMKNKSNNKAWDFLLGGIAGGLGSWITNPMDVVKTRLQTDSTLYGGSVWACTKAVWNEDGAAAFLRGSIPRLLHKVPANAFFFLFYEVFRRLLRVQEAVQQQQQRQQASTLAKR